MVFFVELMHQLKKNHSQGCAHRELVVNKSYIQMNRSNSKLFLLNYLGVIVILAAPVYATCASSNLDRRPYLFTKKIIC